jgi:hypothetical protein
MQTKVEFRSSKYPPYECEEEQINPGLWGKRLAEYLVEKLAEKGIATDEMNSEDWGWFVPIRTDGFRLALCLPGMTRTGAYFLVSEITRIKLWQTSFFAGMTHSALMNIFRLPRR